MQKHMGIGDFRNIPNGAPGLQNRLGSCGPTAWRRARSPARSWWTCSPPPPPRTTASFPRKGSLSVGADADIVVFDPKGKGTITSDDMLHDVDYCSYEGMEQIGRVDQVFLRGKRS